MILPAIILKPLYHDGVEHIGIYAPAVSQLNTAIRKLPGIKWSRTNKVWYMPFNQSSYRQIVAALQPLAAIDHKELKQYLQKSKQVGAAQITGAGKAGRSKPAVATPAWNLSPGNLQALNRFIQQLKLKAYSPSTVSTYRNEFLQLLQLLKNKSVQELTVADLRRYMLYAMEKEGISENTAHSRINALKFYFEQVLGREKFFWEIPRPKKRNELPRIFSQDEVAAIINSTGNKKHKVMLMLAYSAGLRVSEVVSLKTSDIDSRRMTIMIRQAKGKKDRLAALSPVLLVMLREYARQYKPEKIGYLFEGASNGVCYSTRSLQEVIQAAKKKAGIVKPGSIHALRHSFATHLIDRGTDVTMIQKLLGHNDIKTTLRYLHTTNKDLLRIISPLDDLRLS